VCGGGEREEAWCGRGEGVFERRINICQSLLGSCFSWFRAPWYEGTALLSTAEVQITCSRRYGLIAVHTPERRRLYECLYLEFIEVQRIVAQLTYMNRIPGDLLRLSHYHQAFDTPQFIAAS
jgi:hypothetical protein